MMIIEELRNRYVAFFWLEPTASVELELIGKELGLLFPSDFTSVAKFSCGGLLAGISHNAIAARGPGTNITDETNRLRGATGLAHSFVVLAEPPASLIVMNVVKTTGSPAVIWCDAIDVSRLGS